jgi:hypothetical protein
MRETPGCGIDDGAGRARIGHPVAVRLVKNLLGNKFGEDKYPTCF